MNVKFQIEGLGEPTNTLQNKVYFISGSKKTPGRVQIKVCKSAHDVHETIYPFNPVVEMPWIK